MTITGVARVPASAHPASRLRRWTPSHLTHRGGRVLRLCAGLVVLGFLVWRLGTGPFLDGLRATTWWAVLVALLVTAGTTWCCSMRWSLISRRLSQRVPLRTAYVAYYRSQLINATVPGGVVGDVDRAVRHGWRGVVLDRVLGQGVQMALVVALLLPGGWRWVGLAAVLLVVLAGGAVLLLSTLAVAGHLLVFLAAAESVGVDLSLVQLLPIGALVLLGSAIPLNVAGWGPREGVAVWAFTAYGAPAAVGLTVSVTFGVLATVATLPGLLALGRSRDG